MKVFQYRMIGGEAPLTASEDGFCAFFTIVRETKEPLADYGHVQGAGSCTYGSYR
jgi:hypothetical protein